jgi:hypothetical protein
MRKPFVYSPSDIKRLALIYGLPQDLVETILSKKTVKYNIFGHKIVNHTWAEYDFMLLGASVAYRNQELIGRKLPNNDPRVEQIIRYFNELGVSIQYHPEHGMIIVEQN